MKKIMFIVLIASVAFSCKGKNAAKWSKADKDAFMTNCVSGATATMGADKANNYCSCMQGKLETKYPDAKKMDEATISGMTDMAKDCLK
jgi:hypothetical protein